MLKISVDSVLCECYIFSTAVGCYVPNLPPSRAVGESCWRMQRAAYPWTPGDTAKDGGGTYGASIVGASYKIRLQCAASISYTAYSAYFDLSLTSMPTHVPTPLPSAQPTPVRGGGRGGEGFLVHQVHCCCCCCCCCCPACYFCCFFF